MEVSTNPASSQCWMLLELDDIDELQTKSRQLRSLLQLCFGGGGEWFGEISNDHRDNVLQLAATLAEEVAKISTRAKGKNMGFGGHEAH